MIRGGTGADSAAMGRIYSEAWKKAYAGIVPDEFLNRLTPETTAPPADKISPDNSLVYDVEGEAVGLVSFGPARTGEGCEIYSIYVRPDHWKSGIGGRLFAAACEKLAADGYKKLILWTLTENSNARAFYERMGMHRTAERIIEIAGKPLSETGYELDI